MYDTFESYWNKEKERANEVLGESASLKLGGFREVIDTYLFTEITSQRDEIIGTMKITPRLKERSSVAERIADMILEFIEMFVDGIEQPAYPTIFRKSAFFGDITRFKTTHSTQLQTALANTL